MARHLILVSDGRKYDVDNEPVEDGAFLRFEWNGATHRIPLMSIRDLVTTNPPAPIPAASRRAAVEPETYVSTQAREATAPAPEVGPLGAGAPHVGQVPGQERPIPAEHPAMGGSSQMIEVLDQETGRMVKVPVSTGDSLSPSDTEVLG